MVKAASKLGQVHLSQIAGVFLHETPSMPGEVKNPAQGVLNV